MKVFLTQEESFFNKWALCVNYYIHTALHHLHSTLWYLKCTTTFKSTTHYWCNYVYLLFYSFTLVLSYKCSHAVHEASLSAFAWIGTQVTKITYANTCARFHKVLSSLFTSVSCWRNNRCVVIPTPSILYNPFLIYCCSAGVTFDQKNRQYPLLKWLLHG